MPNLKNLEVMPELNPKLANSELMPELRPNLKNAELMPKRNLKRFEILRWMNV